MDLRQICILSFMRSSKKLFLLFGAEAPYQILSERDRRLSCLRTSLPDITDKSLLKFTIYTPVACFPPRRIGFKPSVTVAAYSTDSIRCLAIISGEPDEHIYPFPLLVQVSQIDWLGST